MFLEALSRWFRSELQQEILYEDDLVIKTESPKELEERYGMDKQHRKQMFEGQYR